MIHVPGAVGLPEHLRPPLPCAALQRYPQLRSAAAARRNARDFASLLPVL